MNKNTLENICHKLLERSDPSREQAICEVLSNLTNENVSEMRARVEKIILISNGLSQEKL